MVSLCLPSFILIQEILDEELGEETEEEEEGEGEEREEENEEEEEALDRALGEDGNKGDTGFLILPSGMCS